MGGLPRPDTLRPYDLRHSYLTEVYLATGDLGAVQAIGGHRQQRTVQRYTGAAVNPLALAAESEVAPANG